MPKAITPVEPPAPEPREGAAPPPASPLQALAAEVQGAQDQAVADATMADVGEQGGEVQPATMPNAVAVAHLFRAVRATVCVVAGLEAPKRTLTDEKTDKLGEIWGAVLDAYGIQLADKAGKHFVIVAAGIQSVELLEETFIETRKEIIAKDAARPPQQLPPPAAADGAPQPIVTATAPRGYTEGSIKPAFAQ